MFGGPPYVAHRGRRLSVPEGGKRLLAFVALRGRRVDRRHAAGVLWPTGNDERAAGNLRSALWRLKGAGIQLLETDKIAIYLRPETEVDVDLLEGWAARVIRGEPNPGDLRAGPFGPDIVELLPGWYDDWVIFERERIRQRLMHAYEALTRLLIQAERRAEAVEAGMAVVNMEPLRESAQRVLVEAHLSEGNKVEAMRCFRTYERLVHDELGVEPGTQFTQFVRSSIAGGGPANLSPGSETLLEIRRPVSRPAESVYTGNGDRGR